MRRNAVLFAAILASPLAPASSQPLPKDVTRTVDSFTGDTTWSTKYGRLDNPEGCGRLNVAITWHLVTGKDGPVEVLGFQYFEVDDPFHKARWLVATGAAVNLDGEITQAKKSTPMPNLDFGRHDKSESALFVFPAGTLRRIAEARGARLRITGTQRSCTGEIELNMKNRIHALFYYLDKVKP